MERGGPASNTILRKGLAYLASENSTASGSPNKARIAPECKQPFRFASAELGSKGLFITLSNITDSLTELNINFPMKYKVTHLHKKMQTFTALLASF